MDQIKPKTVIPAVATTPSAPVVAPILESYETTVAAPVPVKPAVDEKPK
jgi:hypothetical protein